MQRHLARPSALVDSGRLRDRHDHHGIVRAPHSTMQAPAAVTYAVDPRRRRYPYSRGGIPNGRTRPGRTDMRHHPLRADVSPSGITVRSATRLVTRRTPYGADQDRPSVPRRRHTRVTAVTGSVIGRSEEAHPHDRLDQPLRHLDRRSGRVGRDHDRARGRAARRAAPAARPPGRQTACVDASRRVPAAAAATRRPRSRRHRLHRRAAGRRQRPAPLRVAPRRQRRRRRAPARPAARRPTTVTSPRTGAGHRRG